MARTQSRGELRRIPSVDSLLRTDAARRACEKFGRPLVKLAVQAVLGDARSALERGVEAPDDEILLARALRLTALNWYGLSTVLNATGVILHTGLGRAPLPERAARAAADAARNYVDLEVDRERGTRGRRTTNAEVMLVALTGAEAALVVNNNAAALLLVLAGLARRREVPVSRGELIEIGGEFRLPDIMAASGAKLVEVGTTNRTRVGDYRRAITARTALILKVHPSNYRIQGFTDAAPVSDLVALAATAGIPLAHDVGSGLLDRYPGVPKDEPSIAESLRAGTDLVTFSGDKLLGGPQAGLIVGRAEAVARLRRSPVARAVRMDKMNVAALEATLRLYAVGRRGDIPIWRMLAQPKRRLLERARAVAAHFEGASAGASEAAFGGGSV